MLARFESNETKRAEPQAEARFQPSPVRCASVDSNKGGTLTHEGRDHRSLYRAERPVPRPAKREFEFKLAFDLRQGSSVAHEMAVLAG